MAQQNVDGNAVCRQAMVSTDDYVISFDEAVKEISFSKIGTGNIALKKNAEMTDINDVTAKLLTDTSSTLTMKFASGAPNDTKFGGIKGLTKGIVFRKSDGTHHTIFNAKTNGDLRMRMYDVTYAESSPSTSYGVSFRRTFAGQDKNGVVIRLDGDLNESLDVIIQDNLTGITSFKVVAQGHVVSGNN